VRGIVVVSTPVERPAYAWLALGFLVVGQWVTFDMNADWYPAKMIKVERNTFVW
jgi:hypothetical protein